MYVHKKQNLQKGDLNFKVSTLLILKIYKKNYLDSKFSVLKKKGCSKHCKTSYLLS